MKIGKMYIFLAICMPEFLVSADETIFLGDITVYGASENLESLAGETSGRKKLESVYMTMLQKEHECWYVGCWSQIENEYAKSLKLEGDSTQAAVKRSQKLSALQSEYATAYEQTFGNKPNLSTCTQKSIIDIYVAKNAVKWDDALVSVARLLSSGCTDIVANKKAADITRLLGQFEIELKGTKALQKGSIPPLKTRDAICAALTNLCLQNNAFWRSNKSEYSQGSWFVLKATFGTSGLVQRWVSTFDADVWSGGNAAKLLSDCEKEAMEKVISLQDCGRLLCQRADALEGLACLIKTVQQGVKRAQYASGVKSLLKLYDSISKQAFQDTVPIFDVPTNIDALREDVVRLQRIKHSLDEALMCSLYSPEQVRILMQRVQDLSVMTKVLH